MYYVQALLAIICAYILGSVNYAILITQLAGRGDIRSLGNHNPGASNVMREVGKGWGMLVTLLDALKGVLPILLFRALFFSRYNNMDFGVLYLIGIFAVLGHCKSIFLKFRGGGGISTMLGVSLFFIPLEFLAAMLVGGTIVLLFYKDAEYRFGLKTPTFFVTLTPFFALLSSLFLDINLVGHFSLGGHFPSVVAGSFIMSLMLLAINVIFLQTRVRK